MLRIGVDMIEIARIESAMRRYGERFYDRFYTATECAQVRGVPARLAARFAAKEAVAKALGTGIGAVSWVDIEIESDVHGRPVVRLHNAAARIAEDLGLREWQISMSHTRDHAIAFVVAVGDDPTVHK